MSDLIFMNGTFKIGQHEYMYNSWGGISQRNATAYSYNQEYNETYNSPEYIKASNRLMQIRATQVLEACGGSWPKTLLDFGYGNGAFLDHISNHVPNCKGFDIASTNYHEGKKWNRIEWIDPFSPPDVATFWDSLEHCVDPINEVRAIGANIVCISLPWLDEDNFVNWHHRKPNEHLHHFTPESLEEMMSDAGYEILSYSNNEDEIRRPRTNHPNILSATFLLC